MDAMVFVACALTAVLALAMCVGFFLSKRFEVARMAMVIADPEKVWDMLADPRTHASWRKDINRILRKPDENGLPCWIEVGALSRREIQVHSLRPPSRMAAELKNGIVPMRGALRIQVTPRRGGCQVSVWEEVEIASPLCRFIVRYLVGRNSSADMWLLSLGEKFGQRVKIEDIEG